jgi:hypothetical protein
MFPISPEVGNERFKSFEHRCWSCRSFDQMI